MTAAEALDRLFRYKLGDTVMCRRKSDGTMVATRVAGRQVIQGAGEVLRRYTLKGEGGSVTHDAELVEGAPQ